MLKTVLTDILTRGTTSKEFKPVEIEPTVNMLIALLNGIMRQQLAALDNLEGVESATIVFCKNALVNQKEEPIKEK